VTGMLIIKFRNSSIACADHIRTGFHTANRRVHTIDPIR
jgi:hypothetical protein